MLGVPTVDRSTAELIKQNKTQRQTEIHATEAGARAEVGRTEFSYF